MNEGQNGSNNNMGAMNPAPSPNGTFNQSSRESYYSDNNSNIPSSSSKKHIDKKWIFIILGLIVIAGIVVMIIFVTKSKHEKQTIESIQESYIEDSIRSADDGTVGTNWKTFRFKIKDQRNNLPLKYKELHSMSGFALNSHYERINIEPKKHMAINLYKNGKLALYVDVYNSTTDKLNYKDSEITKISQIKANVDTYGATPVIFPGELEVGMNMTQEGLFNIFGETKNIKVSNNGEYVSTAYRYAKNPEKPASNYYEIELVNNVIFRLTLDHRG